MIKRIVALAAALGAAWSAQGQWMTQEIPLRAGWNAVWVGVSPRNLEFADSLEEAVGEGNVEGVWMWDKNFTMKEFTSDEGELLASSPHWRMWTSDPALSFLNTIESVAEGQTYLIQVKSGGTWRVKGKARIPRQDWYPNALNLVGFPVGSGGTSVGALFEGAKNVETGDGYRNQIYQILADGSSRTVAKPELQRVAAGEALWVYSEGDDDFAGPVRVEASGGRGLNFGDRVQKLELTVRNEGAEAPARELTLRLLASEEPPEGEEGLAGGVPLYLQEGGDWEEVTGPVTVRLGAGESAWTGTFGVDRGAMEYIEDNGGKSYQGVLRLEDAERSVEVNIPVRAVRTRALLGTQISGTQEGLDRTVAQAGLWMGDAVLTQVNCPNYSGSELLPAPDTATIRLLVHVDAEGTARLVQEAWFVPDGDVAPGGALYAGRDLVPPTAESEVYKVSTVAFPRGMAPVEFGGGKGLAGERTARLLIGGMEPTNPFFHPFHPQFDNKDGHFEYYEEDVETRPLERVIRLGIADRADIGENPDEQVSGTYHETLRGLRAQAVEVEGMFTLRKVMSIGRLKTE